MLNWLGFQNTKKDDNRKNQLSSSIVAGNPSISNRFIKDLKAVYRLGMYLKANGIMKSKLKLLSDTTQQLND